MEELDDIKQEIYGLMDSFLVESTDIEGKIIHRSIDRLNQDRQLFVENIMKLVDRIRKDERERIKKIANPKYPLLLPVLDKTIKWIKFHEMMGAEIVFNNLEDEEGNVIMRPIKAIYDSPLAKFQEIMKLSHFPTK